MNNMDKQEWTGKQWIGAIVMSFIAVAVLWFFGNVLLGLN
jgi:hypothetical protein